MKKEERRKLVWIKLLHTAIWAILASMIIYLLYAGLSGKITMLVYVSIGAVLVETAILVIFQWHCPLTLVARKYTDSTQPNFDIYLPAWLAKWNKEIFGALLAVGMALVMWRLATV